MFMNTCIFTTHNYFFQQSHMQTANSAKVYFDIFISLYMYQHTWYIKVGPVSTTIGSSKRMDVVFEGRIGGEEQGVTPALRAAALVKLDAQMSGPWQGYVPL